MLFALGSETLKSEFWVTLDCKNLQDSKGEENVLVVVVLFDVIKVEVIITS